MSAPRVLFYVQHLLGIGHLARASRVASALVEDGFELTLVTGGAPVTGFPATTIRQVALPPVMASDNGFGGLADLKGEPIDDAFRHRRREMLLRIFEDTKPDAVIIEAFPFGRRQMRFELLPLLEAIASASPRPLAVTSVRDLLQERVKPGRNEETLVLVQRYFDLVLVHGDPAFARLEDTFPLASQIHGKVAYSGLVSGPAPAPSSDRFDVLISAGGGAAGRDLVRAAVGAARMAPDGQRWGLIAGPNLPASDFEAAAAEAPAPLSLFRFREDFGGLLANAELSVSQAGYNTVCDLLRAGCRALLVPFAAGGETEQTARAERLERMGLASVIAEEALNPSALHAAVEKALAGPKPPGNTLDLDGAKGSARVLRRHLEIRP